jgi:hypothetical protein
MGTALIFSAKMVFGLYYSERSKENWKLELQAKLKGFKSVSKYSFELFKPDEAKE